MKTYIVYLEMKIVDQVCVKADSLYEAYADASERNPGWKILGANSSELMSAEFTQGKEREPTMITKLPDESDFKKKMVDVYKEVKDHVSTRGIDRQLKEQFTADADKKIDEYTNGKSQESPLTSKHWK